MIQQQFKLTKQGTQLLTISMNWLTHILVALLAVLGAGSLLSAQYLAQDPMVSVHTKIVNMELDVGV